MVSIMVKKSEKGVEVGAGFMATAPQYWGPTFLIWLSDVESTSYVTRDPAEAIVDNRAIFSIWSSFKPPGE